jgi:hypothetical protein
VVLGRVRGFLATAIALSRGFNPSVLPPLHQPPAPPDGPYHSRFSSGFVRHFATLAVRRQVQAPGMAVALLASFDGFDQVAAISPSTRSNYREDQAMREKQEMRKRTYFPTFPFPYQDKENLLPLCSPPNLLLDLLFVPLDLFPPPIVLLRPRFFADPDPIAAHLGHANTTGPRRATPDVAEAEGQGDQLASAVPASPSCFVSSSEPSSPNPCRIARRRVRARLRRDLTVP